MMIDPCEVCGKSTRELEDLRREVQEFKTSGRVNITALLAGLDAVKRTLQAGALTPTVVSMITVLTYRLIPPPTGTGELLGTTYDDLVKERDALRAERDELAATLTVLDLTDMSGPARHALATADQFGCLMPSYCGSPVADELRRYGLSKASTDPRWEGWEQLTDIGKAVRAATGAKS